MKARDTGEISFSLDRRLSSKDETPPRRYVSRLLATRRGLVDDVGNTAFTWDVHTENSCKVRGARSLKREIVAKGHFDFCHSSVLTSFTSYFLSLIYIG